VEIKIINIKVDDKTSAPKNISCICNAHTFQEPKKEAAAIDKNIIDNIH
jgi:hypothetical protein